MADQADRHTPPGPLGMKAADYAAARDWSGYFRTVVGRPARETCLAALDVFGAPPGGEAPFAVDLGCGEGRDTLELLRRGWRVLAIDAHPEAFEHLLPRVAPGDRGRLGMRIATFRRAILPACDLLNASYALPFCEPDDFPGLWSRIVGAIRPGGLFAGQLFGDRDDWNRRGDRTHHSRARVDDSLAGFEPLLLNEEEKDEAMADGSTKHWHIFHIVARKNE